MASSGCQEIFCHSNKSAIKSLFHIKSMVTDNSSTFLQMKE